MAESVISIDDFKNSLQVSLYIAASLDGYIARKDGSIDWLETLAGSDDDYGYGDFMETVKVSVMGRVTYDQVLTFPEWPYDGRRVVVLSRHVNTADPRVEITAENPSQLISRLRSAYPGETGRIWLVGGGETVKSFLAEGLVDEIILTLVPILLGDGIRLFPPGFPETVYTHQETRTYPTGLLQMTYLRKS